MRLFFLCGLCLLLNACGSSDTYKPGYVISHFNETAPEPATAEPEQD
jgi:hypothetical protein